MLMNFVPSVIDDINAKKNIYYFAAVKVVGFLFLFLELKK